MSGTLDAPTFPISAHSQGKKTAMAFHDRRLSHDIFDKDGALPSLGAIAKKTPMEGFFGYQQYLSIQRRIADPYQLGKRPLQGRSDRPGHPPLPATNC
jgi:hypothetical protein